MFRKVYKKLLDWKNSNTRKPLILLGARQVGKTWLMKEFGNNEYENVVYINCDTEPLTKELFLNDYDLNRLLLGFQAISGKSIDAHNTLIIIDEIQEAPRALHSLKYFCENAPQYHIITAGSLLGVTLSQKESFPVGKVDMLKIYPMDFEEFMLAMEQKTLCDILNASDFGFAETFSSKLTELLYQYYFVGGMPEAVKAFSENKNLNEVRKIQSVILDSYRNDISKHTSKTESIRIGQVLSSLPSQLAKENKKFIYGVAKKGGRAADFELAIQWLIDAGLVYKISRVNKVALPLKFYEDISAFKLFFLDVGLLCCMADVPASVLLLNADNLTEYKGMVTEEYVVQQLSSSNLKPYYWSKDNSSAELDFIIQRDNTIYPIEVKASTNVRGKTIAQFVKDNPSLKGLRFSMLGFKQQELLTNYPLYTLPFCLSEFE
ncbi:MAG: ATP-binding protein [Muribaculaceae bacterium]|nr:ATP-binding protein [Muribaculaceae bacterium]